MAARALPFAARTRPIGLINTPNGAQKVFLIIRLRGFPLPPPPPPAPVLLAQFMVIMNEFTVVRRIDPDRPEVQRLRETAERLQFSDCVTTSRWGKLFRTASSTRRKLKTMPHLVS